MYVLIVYDRYDEGSVAAVLGPFDLLAEAQDRHQELFGDRYRHTTIQQVTGTLPDWAA